VKNGQLTKREEQILIMIANGQSNKDISRQLSIEVSTVENHIHHIYQKLNLSSRSQATAFAYKHGLITTIE
jgi:DNA-binding NarL/FixJ family response regulator